MKLPFFCPPIPGQVVDERFLNHRLRSTSLGGMAACLLAVILFEVNNWRHHVWDWQLLSIPILMVVVKLSAMAWYHFTD